MSSGFQPPRPFTRTGDVPRIRTLGTLMIWQGALTLLWFLFCLLGMAVGALSAFIGSANALEGWVIGVAYLVFAVGALASAVPMILAGIQVRLVRGRRLAFWALGLTAASVVCGNVFCAPTGFPLAVYGLVVLLNPDTKEAFDRVAQGEYADGVEALLARAARGGGRGAGYRGF